MSSAKKKTSKKTTKSKKSTKSKKTSTPKKTDDKGFMGKPVLKGDLIKLDKFGRTLSTIANSQVFVFEASNLEDAKQLPNYDPKNVNYYKPEILVVGDNKSLLAKLGEELETMKYGEEKWITLEPKDAFGERDPKQIEKMSFKKFMSVKKEKPRLGMEYIDEKGNRRGRVIFADQGRIRVDFNHFLAGRPVEYRIKPLERIEEFENKVIAFLEMRIANVVPELFKINHNEKESVLNIEVPEYFAFQQQNMGMIEFAVSMDLQTHLNIETVNFVHSYKKRPVPGEEEVELKEKELPLIEDEAKKEEETPEKTKKTTKKKKSTKKSTKKTTKKSSKKKSS